MKKHWSHTLRQTLRDHRPDTAGETSSMAPRTAAIAFDLTLARVFSMPAFNALALAGALWSATCLGAEAAASGAGGQKLVIEAIQEIKKLDVEAIRQGKWFQPRILLSMDISKTPLRTALKLLSRKTGIKVLVAAEVPNEEISVKFDMLPVEEGLKRMLKAKNYLLSYAMPQAAERQGNDGTGSSGNHAGQNQPETDGSISAEQRITEVRILSSGSATGGPNIVEIKEESHERTREIEALVERAQKGATPKDRMAALEEFQELADDEAIPSILPVLHDEDEGVRQMALETLQNQSSGTPPVEEIAEFAYSDLSPKLRMEALAVVVEFRPGQAEAYIQRALKDADPKVRDHAQRMLDLNAKLAEYN